MNTAHHRGVLLVEVLLATAFLASLFAISTQVALVSMQSTTASEEKDVAQRLGRELIEGARMAGESNWYALYRAPRDVARFATTTAGAWIISDGSETLHVGEHRYERSFKVSSTSRDKISGAIQDVYDALNEDPSTLLLTATVSVDKGGSVSISEYITRWRNKLCTQSEWGSAGNIVPHIACATLDYDGTAVYPYGSVQTVNGTIKLSPQ